MPFTWTCTEDGHESHHVEERIAHELEAHDGQIVTHTLTVTQQGKPQRRTWSCAACARQVEREDDGSMLCDDCQTRRTDTPARSHEVSAGRAPARWLP